jgi:ABC-type transport system involved in cytochrome c biogenesis permease subunit
MNPSRLRAGEIVAGLGALLLLVSLFLRWYAPGGEGWGSLGWLALVPVVLAIAAGLALVVATLTERDSAAIPVAIGVATVPWALLAVLAILVRLVAQPGPNAETLVRWPAWMGLAGAVAILVGAWRAIGDERTGSAHAREQTERALSVRGTPRPAPPRRDDPS